MDQKPVTTPCQTGRLCQIPRQRTAILDDDNLTDEQRQAQLAKNAEACDHTSHPDDWFEDPGVGYATTAYWRREKAKYLCLTACPHDVRMACLTKGLQTKPDEEGKVELVEPYGTYGGYYVEERQQLAALINETKEGTDERTDADGVPEGEGPQGASAQDPEDAGAGRA